MSELERLGRVCAGPLQQLAAILERIDASAYRTPGPGGAASPGAQVRHVLDVGGCLLSGWESGRIDYDRRPRDAAAEYDPAIARARLDTLLAQLDHCTRTARDAPLRVRQDEERSDTGWAASSRARELRFLLSHTVHHCAILSLLLEPRGVALPRDFGIAPATLRGTASRGVAGPRGGAAPAADPGRGGSGP